MAWRIEYTNHPWLKKKRRKILEREVAEAIDDIERLLKIKGDDGFILGDSDFAAESAWVKDLKKHHIAIRNFKVRGDDWVASIVFKRHPTMIVEEVKNTLKSVGLGEYSIYGLGVTNNQTVGELLTELQEKLDKPERVEWAKDVDIFCSTALEALLEQGIIKLSDGALDALRKIEQATG